VTPFPIENTPEISESCVRVRIGTRGSALALWQADHIATRLKEAHPDVEVEQIIFTTRGDHILDRPLAEIGGKGLFTKELEEALLEGRIDLAVHSLKDMPTQLPDGLVLGAVPVRGDVRDCLVVRAGEGPETARRIGTASLRRACLARRRWPEATVESIRGNVPTRVGRVHEQGERRMDLVILAAAGLGRLKMAEARDDIQLFPLNPEHWIPAVGQGALALECREGDAPLRDRLEALHHPETALCVAAERAFLRAVEGDCRVPVGALATHDLGNLRLRAFVGHPEGTAFHEHVAFGTDPQDLGRTVAEAVLAAGGRAVLASLRP